MRKKGDIYTTPDRPYANTEEEAVDNCKGKVMDLLIPIISLIDLLCGSGMIYTGGFFDGVGFEKHFLEVMLPRDWCMEASLLL